MDMGFVYLGCDRFVAIVFVDVVIVSLKGAALYLYTSFIYF